jgi:phosphotransferase system HPr (HPr) family protein
MSLQQEGGAESHRVVQIVNAAGLHARPCHSIVSVALEYGCELRIGCGGREVNGRSILELMTLGAAAGAQLTLRARGEGAEELVERLAGLVAAGFDEAS